MIALLNGCGQEEPEDSRFKTVEEFSNGYFVVVDKETGIGYLRFWDSITVMYDKDGEIYRPNGWRDYD